MEEDIVRKTSVNYSTWFIMLGILVSFFAFLNGMDLFQRVKTALNEANEFRYHSEISISINQHSKKEELLGELRKIPGNIMFTKYLVYLNQRKVYHLSDIIVKQEEDFLYPLISGRYPDAQSKKKEVTIGRKMEEYCFWKNGERYLKIEGEDYLVVGVIGSEASDIVDGKLILDERSMGDDLRERILQQNGWNILCTSNQQDLELEMADFDSACRELEPSCELFFQVQDENQTFFIESATEDGGFYWAICGFAMINCIVVSEFWILRRKQEMLVRKIWGYTNLRLFLMLFKELLCISGGTVCFGWMIQIIVTKLFGSELGICFDMNKFLQSILFMVASSLLIVLVPTYKVSREFPCEKLEV